VPSRGGCRDALGAGVDTRLTNYIRSHERWVPRSSVTQTLDVAASTLKKHVHNLVQKSGDPSLDVAIQRVMREALSGDSRQ